MKTKTQTPPGMPAKLARKLAALAKRQNELTNLLVELHYEAREMGADVDPVFMGYIAHAKECNYKASQTLDSCERWEPEAVRSFCPKRLEPIWTDWKGEITVIRNGWRVPAEQQ